LKLTPIIISPSVEVQDYGHKKGLKESELSLYNDSDQTMPYLASPNLLSFFPMVVPSDKEFYLLQK